MSKKAFDQNDILGIFPEGDTLSNELRSAKAGAVFLSTLGKVPIVPMSIYGMKKGLWDYILKGIRPNITLRVGKPFGPFTLPKDKSIKEKVFKDIGDEMMCRIAALLPKECHGQYKNHPDIEKYSLENNL